MVKFVRIHLLLLSITSKGLSPQQSFDPTKLQSPVPDECSPSAVPLV
jgi:hypothetical protein